MTFRIILRGSKGEIRERDPAALYDLRMPSKAGRTLVAKLQRLA
jgi:hypothetical protein